MRRYFLKPEVYARRSDCCMIMCQTMCIMVHFEAGAYDVMEQDDQCLYTTLLG